MHELVTKLLRERDELVEAVVAMHLPRVTHLERQGARTRVMGGELVLGSVFIDLTDPRRVWAETDGEIAPGTYRMLRGTIVA